MYIHTLCQSQSRRIVGVIHKWVKWHQTVEMIWTLELWRTTQWEMNTHTYIVPTLLWGNDTCTYLRIYMYMKCKCTLHIHVVVMYMYLHIQYTWPSFPKCSKALSSVYLSSSINNSIVCLLTRSSFDLNVQWWRGFRWVIEGQTCNLVLITSAGVQR